MSECKEGTLQPGCETVLDEPPICNKVAQKTQPSIVVLDKVKCIEEVQPSLDALETCKSTSNSEKKKSGSSFFDNKRINIKESCVKDNKLLLPIGTSLEGDER